jgi:hypothetical protein
MDRREATGRSAPRVAAWESGLSAPCDADRLGRLLNDVADGAYGPVESLRGTLRSGSGWVEFDLSGGQAQVAPVTPGANAAPRVVAVGATQDLMRLRAALIACLRPAAA